LRQSFLGVPKELEEAARIDGCSRLGEWWNVMIPAARADLITLAMFVFIGTWSDFLWPLVILDDPQSLHLAARITTVVEQFFARLADCGGGICGVDSSCYGVVSVASALHSSQCQR
jgi:ABC-type glycerol-3-phosphate transport system permease component